jgi:hypothetical protein
MGPVTTVSRRAETLSLAVILVHGVVMRLYFVFRYHGKWIDGDSAAGRMKVEGRADGPWTAERKQ